MIDLLGTIDYREEIDRSYRDAEVRAARWALVQELQRAWEAHLAEEPKPGLTAFLDATTLRSRDDQDEDSRGVTVATVHASKGLEFPVVYLPFAWDSAKNPNPATLLFQDGPVRVRQLLAPWKQPVDWNDSAE